jgi:hypothetical protein
MLPDLSELPAPSPIPRPLLTTVNGLSTTAIEPLVLIHFDSAPSVPEAPCSSSPKALPVERAFHLEPSTIQLNFSSLPAPPRSPCPPLRRWNDAFPLRFGHARSPSPAPLPPFGTHLSNSIVSWDAATFLITSSSNPSAPAFKSSTLGILHCHWAASSTSNGAERAAASVDLPEPSIPSGWISATATACLLVAIRTASCSSRPCLPQDLGLRPQGYERGNHL